ncbi:histone-lysine N-methyltransferase SETDB1-A-like isoform X1 [Thunnus thynnus]|uniref:histone-lysine N-methyltransferase SETDB1-A-like isoform X1 n=2 Tax=Thunnus thynnus TaxID=8237 RepID=UPI00352987C7
MNMEEDEMEMTKEELQNWIRERVRKMVLIPPDVLEKCNLLLSLLERREKQAAKLLKLCKSVTACEAIVKKQYSLLGWEYRDTDSDDDDDNINGCGSIPSSPCESVHSETQVPSPPATNGPTPLPPKREESADLNGDNGKKSSVSLKRELVVVLTRLPKSEIADFLPTPQNQYSEHESLSDSDSDVEWKPEDDSDDLDHCFLRANKRRKTDQNKEKPAKSNTTKTSALQNNVNTDTKSNETITSTPQASANTAVKSQATKTSTPQASTNTNAKSNALKTSTPQASTNTDAKSNASKTSTPQASTNTDAKSNASKTSTPQASTTTDGRSNTGGISTPQGNRNTNAKSNTPTLKPANTNGALPVCIVSTLCQSSDKATKVPPSLPQEKIIVGMRVLARRRAMSWKWGKIMEIVKRDDGGLKYKINFEEKGKSLVSGHHIAFQSVPKVDQLYVGARVVVKCQDNELRFRPGIMAELPSRKNHARFLVFIDDHTPVYVGLPLLHLVCRPLEDAVDDIPDGSHKSFMRQYIKDWPYPHLTQCRPGQSLNAELNGVQQRCEVQVVDCSLIQVVFQGDQHKEWIHRGSMRLEHVARFLEIKRKEEDKND